MGSRTHCAFPLFYNPDSFPLADRIKVAFKLRNMAKLGGNGGTNRLYSIDRFFFNLDNPNRHLVQEKGEMVTTLNQQHIPI